MRIPKSKRQLLIYYMSGFLIGIFYANLIGKPYLDASGIFNEYSLRQYIQFEVNSKEYLFYLIQIRLFPFSLLIMAGCTRFRSVTAAAVLVWTGFCGGILAVAAVLGLGLKGILICLAGFFPHMIAYVLAYSIVLWHLYVYPECRWNQTKTVSVAVLLILGILTEAYVNPGIVKSFIKLLG